MPGRSQIPYVIVDEDGNALADAEVSITHRVGGAPATVYTSETSAITLGQGLPQVNTQKNGRIPGWLPEGSYNLEIVHPFLPGSPWTRAVEIIYGAGVGYLADNTIDAAQIQVDSVQYWNIAWDSIQAAKVVNATLLETEFFDGAASSRTLATSAITDDKLATNSIDARTIADDAVTTAKIALLGVGTSELVDSAVVAGKYGAGSVDANALGTASVQSQHMADDVITNDKLDVEELEAAQLATSTLPPGIIMYWPSSTVSPDVGGRWLVCDGATLASATYPRLFAAIGYTFGGSGSTFKVPDLRGRVVWGYYPGNLWGAAFATADGITNHYYRIPQHSHGITNGVAAVTGSGGHEHNYYAVSYVNSQHPKITGTAYSTMAAGNTHAYWNGNYVGANNASSHSHGMTGFWGDNAGPAEAPSYMVLNHYIKVA